VLLFYSFKFFLYITHSPSIPRSSFIILNCSEVLAFMPSESKQSKPLFGDFPGSSPEEWRIAAKKLLKGVPFDKKMVFRSYEGIDLRAIYTSEDLPPGTPESQFPGYPDFRRGGHVLGRAGKTWEVTQEISYPTCEEFGAALRLDLRQGQTAVYLPLDGAARAGLDPDQSGAEYVGKGGVSIASLSELALALEGADLSRYPLYVEAGQSGPVFLAMVSALLAQQGKPSGAFRGSTGTDPIGTIVREGVLPTSLEGAYDEMYSATQWAVLHAPHVRTIAASGSPYREAGADAAQELAYAVGTAVEYIRAMLDRGLTIHDIARRVWFTFSIGTDFFMEVARLRAARIVWSGVVEAFGGNEEDQVMMIHARTSGFTLTQVDPYVNMLRATTGGFAAATGGADSIHVAPFDQHSRTPDEFSRRIARNSQIILGAEAHVDSVVDPAGGSWYIEWLTDALAQRSWALFQDIESKGGMAEAVKGGDIQKSVNDTAAARKEGSDRRRDPIVGVSVYANAAEMPLDARPVDGRAFHRRRSVSLEKLKGSPDHGPEMPLRRCLVRLREGAPAEKVALMIEAVSSGATLGEIVFAWRSANRETPAKAEPLPVRRLAEAYEELRSAMARFTARTGSRPRVFLALMGPVGQHQARADFSTAFFAAGGFDILAPGGFDTPEEAARTAAASGAAIAVLCSTDDTYPSIVPAFCASLKASFPGVVAVLAGYPQDHVENFRKAGIDEFIHIRANVAQVLRSLAQRIGVMA
jgi:methylmalonyl-CoA mutase